VRQIPQGNGDGFEECQERHGEQDAHDGVEEAFPAGWTERNRHERMLPRFDGVLTQNLAFDLVTCGS
jgi:hypothetical protein